VDDPQTLAGLIAARPRPLLVGLDLDGTLSPIVAHASQAQLAAGARKVLEELLELDEVHVAAVTGRSRADAIATFDLPRELLVIGSHGREHGGADQVVATDEVAELDALERQARALADRVPGAWVERKPFSVVVHVREAPPDAGAALLGAFVDLGRRSGCSTLSGSAVAEVGHGPLDKGAALHRWRYERGGATVCFIGDDVTDEHAFAALGADDVSVKVGEGPTAAGHRLADPDAVVELLAELVRILRS
jgi:trehalose-phosphatase